MEDNMENNVKIFNTLTRKVETFVPNEDGKVKMYTCGPTVYHFAHIGNLRSYIMEDVLEKTLRYAGYDVKRVMNITDVGHLSSDADTGEDKMLKGAKSTRPLWRLQSIIPMHSFPIAPN
jgi:cysteinyl-tRNA synthetase